MAVVPLAAGDIIVVNDLVTGGDTSLPVGAFGNASVHIVASDVQPSTTDYDGCNVGGGPHAGTVTLTSNRPAKVVFTSGATIASDGSSATLTFTSCGSVQTASYRVVGGDPGDRITITATGSGGRTNAPSGTLLYASDVFNITIASPPPTTPTNTAPTVPGAPTLASGSASPNAGAFTLEWTPSTDAQGHAITYRLEQRDADDVGYSLVPGAGALTSAQYTFASAPEGTWTYRASASDASLSSNFSAASSAIKVDLSAPYAPVGSPDRASESGDGWWKNSVTVSFAQNATTANGDRDLADASAGSGVVSLSAPQTFNTNGAHAAEGNATDAVGHVSGAASFAVRVDTLAPEVVLNDCPATVVRGTSASATWQAWDNQSGLYGAATGGFVLPTSTLGLTNASATIADRVGHGTRVECLYDVVGYSVSSFGSPLSPDPLAWNSAKAGATVPLKFQVHSGNNDTGWTEIRTTTLGGSPVVSFTSKKVPAPSYNATDEVDFVVNATGGTTLRYDELAQQFVYNWKTPTTKGYYVVTLTAQDGSTQQARFLLK